ncbi:MAG: HD domain-containing protein [Deltaproteobacteria bacterium]|nr:HD domain-containing protein [Deltaproteobacteria bacterium]
MQETIHKTTIPDNVLEISKKLIAEGYSAFIVGGAVRDSLLGFDVKDWDIATNASPERIKKLFYYMTSFNLKHGTVTLVSRGDHFEVTTFRGKDSSAASIEEDLSHRDFTLNAMAYDIIGKIIVDPFNGQKDIRKKIIRAVGDPSARFQEDPLRMMRAIRFSLELGYKIDPVTLKSVTLMGADIEKVSIERVRDEFLKILTAKKPSIGLNLLRKVGILEKIMPELLEGYRKRQNDYHKYSIYRHIMETIDFVDSDPILRLSALFHDIAKPRMRKKIEGKWSFYNHASSSAGLAKDIMVRMRFSNEWIAIVTGLVLNHMFDYKRELSDRAIRRLLKKVGIDNIYRLISLRRADNMAHGWGEISGEELDIFKEKIDALVEKCPPLNISDLKINGNDVINLLSIKPGPEVGRILQNLLEAVIEAPELNERDKLMEKLDEL